MFYLEVQKSEVQQEKDDTGGSGETHLSQSRFLESITENGREQNTHRGQHEQRRVHLRRYRSKVLIFVLNASEEESATQNEKHVGQDTSQQGQLN